MSIRTRMINCHCGEQSFFLVNGRHVVIVDAADAIGLATAALSIAMDGARLQRVDAYFSGLGRRPVHDVIVGIRPGKIVDHKNRNQLDNRRANLRHVNYSKSSANRRMPPGYSGLRGVQVGKKLGTWEVYITVDCQRKYLGRFTDKHEAARAYNVAAMAAFGPDAVINQGSIELGEHSVGRPVSRHYRRRFSVLNGGR